MALEAQSDPLDNDNVSAPRCCLEASTTRASRDPDDAETPERKPLPQSFSPCHHGRLEEEEGRGTKEERQRKDSTSLVARSSKS
jgi:hypothetical protein